MFALKKKKKENTSTPVPNPGIESCVPRTGSRQFGVLPAPTEYCLSGPRRRSRGGLLHFFQRVNYIARLKIHRSKGGGGTRTKAKRKRRRKRRRKKNGEIALYNCVKWEERRAEPSKSFFPLVPIFLNVDEGEEGMRTALKKYW